MCVCVCVCVCVVGREENRRCVCVCVCVCMYMYVRHRGRGEVRNDGEKAKTQQTTLCLLFTLSLSLSLSSEGPHKAHASASLPAPVPLLRRRRLWLPWWAAANSSDSSLFGCSLPHSLCRISAPSTRGPPTLHAGQATKVPHVSPVFLWLYSTRARRLPRNTLRGRAGRLQWAQCLPRRSAGAPGQ